MLHTIWHSLLPTLVVGVPLVRVVWRYRRLNTETWETVNDAQSRELCEKVRRTLLNALHTNWVQFSRVSTGNGCDRRAIVARSKGWALALVPRIDRSHWQPHVDWEHGVTAELSNGGAVVRLSVDTAWSVDETVQALRQLVRPCDLRELGSFLANLPEETVHHATPPRLAAA